MDYSFTRWCAESSAVDEYCSFINENEQITKTENEPIYTLKKPINI